MSTDNTPEGLREAVEALAEKWAAVLVECKEVDPRWILDRSVTTLETALTELRAILAEHPATPAEVEHDPRCYQSTGVPDDLPKGLCDCRVLRMIDAADPDAGDADGLTEAERFAITEASYRGGSQSRVLYETVERILATRTRMAAEAGEKRGAEKAAERIAQAIEAARDALHPAFSEGNGNLPRGYTNAAKIARADRIGGE